MLFIMKISFSGAGWGLSFYLGAYKALIEMYGYKEIMNWDIIGVSSGSLLALFVTQGVSFEKVDKILRKFNKYALKHGIYKKNSIYFDIAIDKALKNENAYKTNKLHITTMSFYNKVNIHNSFDSNRHLKKIIQQSMYIPFYSNYSSNNKYIDCGFLQNTMSLGKDTIYFSLIDNIGVSLINELNVTDILYPQTKERYDQLLDYGYEKTKTYFKNIEENIKNQVTNHPKLKTSQYVPMLGWIMYLYEYIYENAIYKLNLFYKDSFIFLYNCIKVK